MSIICLKETDSTNHYLKALSREKSPEEFTTIAAGFQTAGRGQRGSFWEAAPGQNLLFSFIVYPTFLAPQQQFRLSQWVSVSLAGILNEITPGFCVKWPNDLYWGDKKMAGILIENDLQDNCISQAIIGIGLNVNQLKFGSETPNPVSIAQITGKEHPLPELLEKIMKRIIANYLPLVANNPGRLAAMYQDALYRKEGFHPYKDEKGTFKARLIGVNADGQLLLMDSLGTERGYYFKEVRYIF